MRLLFPRLPVALGAFAAYAVMASMLFSAEPVSVGPLGTPLPAADKKIPEIADAIGRFNNLDRAGALELLRKAVEKHPNRLPPAQVIMAQLYAQANQAGPTRGSLEMAVVEVPDDPEAYVILADIELRGRSVTAATLLYEKANGLMASLSKSPSRQKALQPRIYGGLAAVAEQRATLSGDDKTRAVKEWATAEKHLRAWLELEPNSANALQRLARALFKQKTAEKVKEASARLKEAKAADPDVLTPAAQMALYYQQEGDFKNAKKFMDYAVNTAAPNDFRTRMVAAQWCLLTAQEPGQLNGAEEHAARAVQLDPDSLDALILRGGVDMFRKEYGEAERYLQSAVLRSPGNFAASNNLALALCEQDEAKKRRALEYATTNLQAHSQDRYAAEAASTYGWVLYKLGGITKAERDKRLYNAERALAQAISAGNPSPDTIYYYARVIVDRDRKGNAQKARQLLEAALKTKGLFSMRPEAKALADELRTAGG